MALDFRQMYRKRRVRYLSWDYPRQMPQSSDDHVTSSGDHHLLLLFLRSLFPTLTDLCQLISGIIWSFTDGFEVPSIGVLEYLTGAIKVHDCCYYYFYYCYYSD